jgi:hypothetical protein
MWTTTKSSDFAVQRLPKQSAPHHDPYHDYNEAPGNPFSFEMELPNWLMEALGAGPKTGSDVNNSVLDFSSSTFAVFFFCVVAYSDIQNRWESTDHVCIRVYHCKFEAWTTTFLLVLFLGWPFSLLASSDEKGPIKHLNSSHAERFP